MGPAVSVRGVDGSDELVVWTIVVAAGSGSRFGGPKQHEDLVGRTVLQRSVQTARAVSDGVVVVVAPADGDDGGDGRDLVGRDFEGRDFEGRDVVGADRVVAGGATRSRSVANGLAAVPSPADVVLVHDAARPLASEVLFRRVIDAVRSGADAAVPAVSVVDTIRSIDGEVVDRDRLRAVQTPQGFRAGLLRAVHADGGEATDDAGLVEAAGGRVVLVDGERTNLKITEPSDLVIARALVEELRSDVVPFDPEDGPGGDSAP